LVIATTGGLIMNNKLDGAFLWADPSGVVSCLPVISSVDVSELCSRAFNDGGRIALIEYGILPAGDEIVRLKTRFKGCGPLNFTVTDSYRYANMKRGEFEQTLRSSALAFLRVWGVDLRKLSEFVFRRLPISPVLDANDLFHQA
jgi:hypothetical protein